MSESKSENRGSGQRRRRSRGGRNRNRNNNQQGNRDGNRQGGNRQGGKRQGNRSGGPRPRRAPKPKPLTWWQKLLKSIGLYKEPQRSSKGRGGSAPKSNVRNARSDDSEPKPERKPREKREKQERREPVSTGDVTTKRIYLGNLSYEATESDLEELFRGVGTVRRVEIVYNRRTHRSKGYGFVEMLNVDEAKRAVEILHDQFFMGRKLNVSGAKSQGPADADDADDAEDHPGDEAPTPEESLPPAEPQSDSGTKP
ncbi:RNA recognition motif domain-containing protein [Haloferula sp. A504]|uniref:RNA recognition motif domain-containing protein n=1 Tax=Haloferula sp. A504 TaxID=3373601 RepID=UPI0031C3A830|nr:RNA-binding protein [Verrucomicrobiaceae bacterium E54]